MSTVVVVYHSGYGHTQRMAQSVAEGAGAELLAIDADGNLPEGGWETLAAADAIIMGSPTYMGSVSWQFKKFADASSKPWFSQQWKDKVFAGFTNSATMNGDKLSTLHYLFTLAMQHSGIWVGTGLMPSNSKAAQRNDVNYVGSFSGAMAQSPSDAGANEMLPGDLETARLFGARVALAGDGASLAVGAQEGPAHSAHGSVHVFAQGAGRWTPSARLEATSPARGDGFGHSLAWAADGATLAVGARPAGEPPAGQAPRAAVVHMFSNGAGGWTPVAELQAARALVEKRLARLEKFCRHIRNRQLTGFHPGASGRGFRRTPVSSCSTGRHGVVRWIAVKALA